jgi:hypothetical protein
LEEVYRAQNPDSNATLPWGPPQVPAWKIENNDQNRINASNQTMLYILK